MERDEQRNGDFVAESRLIILKDSITRPESPNNSILITFDELKGWVTSGTIIRHFFKYQEAQLLSHRLGFIPKPLVAAVLLRLLSRRSCYFEDEHGERMIINAPTFLNLLWRLIRDFGRKAAFIERIDHEVELLSSEGLKKQFAKNLDLYAPPVYLRTDLVFGLSSGGSVGHVAGVLNNLDNFTGKPIFITTDSIPTVRGDLESHLILPSEGFWEFRELPSFNFNEVLEQNVQKLLRNQKLSFMYQRYSLNNFAGVKLARAYRVPFVLEYNGSEIWVGRNWVRPLKYESLSERIELLNLRAADVIVVISKPLRDELLARGIKDDKILVNPNGVNPGTYSPEVDGSVIRSKYDLEG
ncbi:MAG: glycosyltransferase, partial [Actinobacteria bacterium]|nr:glycosyltransferase [Actinomycetota bacterium]